MSDNYTDDDFDTDNEDDNSIPSLRRAANKSKKLEAELRSLRRELAFAKAGIPLGDPKMNYFVKGYEGELDADAIKAAAIEAGFLASQEPAQEQPQVNPEAQQRVMAASAGAMPEDVSEEAALARLESAMEEGGMDGFLDVVRQYGIPIGTEQ